MGEMQQTPQQKYENHFLRVVTVIFIVLVTYVHYAPEIYIGDYNLTYLIYGIGRFSMPMFFMISGYFAFSKDGHAERSLGRKAKHIFFLIVFLKFFYLGMDLVLAAMGYVDPNTILYSFLVFGDSTAHYWFVASLLTVYLIHLICYKKGIDFKYIIPIGVILLLIDVVIGYLPLFGVTDLFGSRPGDIVAATYVGMSVFFYQAGYYLHKYKDYTDEHWSTPVLLVIMIAGWTWNIIDMFLAINCGGFEGTASAPGPNMFIGTIPLAISMFVLSFRLKEDTILRCRPVEWMGRNISGWMYVFVSVGTYPLQKAILLGHENDFILYQVIGPLIAVAADILAALLMYFLLKKIFKNKAAGGM